MAGFHRNRCNARIVRAMQGDGNTSIRITIKHLDLYVWAHSTVEIDLNPHGAIERWRVGVGQRYEFGFQTQCPIRALTISNSDQGLSVAGVAFFERWLREAIAGVPGFDVREILVIGEFLKLCPVFIR